MPQLGNTQLHCVCEVCHNTVEIKQGTILFDSKWYHPQCWDEKGA